MMPIDPVGQPRPTLLPMAPTGSTPEARRRAAQEFEGQVLGALLQPVFAGTEMSGPFGGGAAEAQWQPMLVDEIARSLSKAGGLGIAAAVLRELDPEAGR
jgi:Rod binding domain-containing protein